MSTSGDSGHRTCSRFWDPTRHWPWFGSARVPDPRLPLLPYSTWQSGRHVKRAHESDGSSQEEVRVAGGLCLLRGWGDTGDLLEPQLTEHAGANTASSRGHLPCRSGGRTWTQNSWGLHACGATDPPSRTHRKSKLTGEGAPLTHTARDTQAFGKNQPEKHGEDQCWKKPCPWMKQMIRGQKGASKIANEYSQRYSSSLSPPGYHQAFTDLLYFLVSALLTDVLFLFWF